MNESFNRNRYFKYIQILLSKYPILYKGKNVWKDDEYFDLGQTIVNEWSFINTCHEKLLELLNGYGERIDIRKYHAIRENVIRNRNTGPGVL